MGLLEWFLITVLVSFYNKETTATGQLGQVNSANEKMSVRNQSTVAVDSALLGYGTVDSVLARPRPLAAPPRRKVRFFVGELSGLLFIILSTVYIFMVPTALAKPGAIRAVMNRVIKRTIDIIGASVGLILAGPLMLLVAMAVKLDSAGPVFYAQMRVGVNRRKRGRRYCQRVGAKDVRQRDRRREDYRGRPFRMIKFRTMVKDAEKKTGPVWATKNDPRITRLGRILRKTRLDEIPQFWSILKGDMSLVGPRPERPSFVLDLCTKVDNYQRRLEVKPGLTGLAQVENGYDSSVASVAEKVRFDLKYIRGWTVWTDVRILLKTVVVVLTGRGAC
jgi:lipopolysaccharide/colanic/teichoic acid biosynthesis glycosyltransferase